MDREPVGGQHRHFPAVGTWCLLLAAEPEKPTGANQVPGPVLLGTNVTRDELFLPEIPLFLTAHLPQTEEKRGRGHTDPAEASPGGASGCHVEAALPPQHGASDCPAHGHGSTQQHPGHLFLCLRKPRASSAVLRLGRVPRAGPHPGCAGDEAVLPRGLSAAVPFPEEVPAGPGEQQRQQRQQRQRGWQL